MITESPAAYDTGKKFNKANDFKNHANQLINMPYTGLLLFT